MANKKSKSKNNRQRGKNSSVRNGTSKKTTNNNNDARKTDDDASTTTAAASASCVDQTVTTEPPPKESIGATIGSMTAILVVGLITIFGAPESLRPEGRATVHHVWFFGWISAVSTGFGVLPLVFTPEFDTFWVGVSNAIAAGMMIAASYSLFIEGIEFNEPDDISDISSSNRTILGAVLGLGFILGTKQFLDSNEDLSAVGLVGADARKALLIMFVMTLHSFSEGVGIGVSFGGQNGTELGVFISASLAVHNVPEGLAVAIVLLPRGVSKLSCALWCIFTSIPQPIMAVPAFLFVNYFIPFLPVGLGFAGGAMAWVAVFELLIEAHEDTKSMVLTGLISTIALAVMISLQNAIDVNSRS